tara:strand:+ start:145 stop:1050 length:906 start_codon:yes stop_codon:yes gene_type:complete
MIIIVNADDLGYSTHRDCGIFDCFRNNKISAASLLVNGPTAAQAAHTAAEEGLHLGLHLNFTEGQPVSSNVPSLVQASGYMYYKLTFWQRDFQIEDICRETVAQLEQFRTLTGHYPQHVDSHQHVHIIPRVAKAIAPILKKYGVTSIRIPDEDVSKYTWLPVRRWQRLTQRYATAINARHIYFKFGIVAPNCFRGLGIGGALMTKQRLESALEGTVGTVEIMVHPGLGGTAQTDGFNDMFDLSQDRVNELKQLEYFSSVPLSDWSAALGKASTVGAAVVVTGAATDDMIVTNVARTTITKK